MTPAPILTSRICRDPADNALLGCAPTARADYLILDNRDLLDLHPFLNLLIVLPRDFESLLND